MENVCSSLCSICLTVVPWSSKYMHIQKMLPSQKKKFNLFLFCWMLFLSYVFLLISLFNDLFRCKSCGQGTVRCPGHCGHIELVSPVFNPLLFNMLHNLLQRTCFYCFHFRASKEEVSLFMKVLLVLPFSTCFAIYFPY